METLKFIVIVFILLACLPIGSVTAGSISLTANNKSLAEGGGSVSYKLRLSAKPAGENNVVISWSTNGQCHVANQNRGYVRSGQVATTSDFADFSAKAVDDSAQESTKTCTVTYKTTSGDSNLNNLSTSQAFTIYDNGDQAATYPALYTSVLGPSSITEGNNAIYSFGIGPSTAPRDKLTIGASSTDGQCQLIQSGRAVEYLEEVIPAGVQGSAIFVVRATEDADVEGNHACTITHSLRTNDTVYSGQTIVSTVVPITDNEASYNSMSVDSEDLFGRAEFGKLNAKDANNDGTADSKQPNLGVFINKISGRRQAIEVAGVNSNCNAVSTPNAIAEDKLNEPNDSFHYPHGLLNFRIICDRPGATAQILFYLDDLYNTDEIELQKYGAASGYVKIEDFKANKFKTQNGPVSLINYQVTDGSELDEDGQANSVIVDPVGIAISSLEPAANVPNQVNNAHNTNSRLETLFVLLPAVIVTCVLGFVGSRFYFKRVRKKSV